MKKEQRDPATKKGRVAAAKVAPTGKRGAVSARAAQTHCLATPKGIAEWMIGQIDEHELLLQVNAVAAIKDLFGKDFVFVSDIGELSIDRRILYQFRKLTGDDIVWVTHQGGGYWSGAHWRKREPGDSSDRTQYEY